MSLTRTVFALVTVSGVLLGLGVPALQRLREESRRDTCAFKLRNIGVALRNYADVNNVLPPTEGSHGQGPFAIAIHYGEPHLFAQQNASQVAGPGFSDWSSPSALPGSGTPWWTSSGAWQLAQWQYASHICPSAAPHLSQAPRTVLAVRYDATNAKITLQSLPRAEPGLLTYAGVAGVLGEGASPGETYAGVFGGARDLALVSLPDGAANTLALGEYLGHYDRSREQWEVRGAWIAAQNISSARTPAQHPHAARWSNFCGPHDGITFFATAEAAVLALNNNVARQTFRQLCGMRDGANISWQGVASEISK